VQQILGLLGAEEDEIFVKRRAEETRRRENARRRKRMKAEAASAGGAGAGKNNGNGNGYGNGGGNRRGADRLEVAERMSALPSFTPAERKEMNERAAKERANALRGTLGANKAAAEALKAKLMRGNGSSGKGNGVSGLSLSDVQANPVKVDDNLGSASLPSKRKLESGGEDGVEEEDVVEEGVVLKKVAVESDEEVVVESSEIIQPVGQVAAEEGLPAEDEEEEEEEVDVVESLSVADIPPVTAIPAKVVDDDDDEPEDNIMLWEPGWKQRYYERKFHVEESNKEFIRE
jgi:5'-3' exoribonuclease 2